MPGNRRRHLRKNLTEADFVLHEQRRSFTVDVDEQTWLALRGKSQATLLMEVIVQESTATTSDHEARYRLEDVPLSVEVFK